MNNCHGKKNSKEKSKLFFLILSVIYKNFFKLPPASYMEIKLNDINLKDFSNFGPVGVIVRMGDKINRLSNVTKSNITLIKTETVRDTLIDLHNYAAMAIMLMDENTNKDIIWSVSDDSGPSGDEGPSSIKNLLDKLAD